MGRGYRYRMLIFSCILFGRIIYISYVTDAILWTSSIQLMLYVPIVLAGYTLPPFHHRTGFVSDIVVGRAVRGGNGNNVLDVCMAMTEQRRSDRAGPVLQGSVSVLSLRATTMPL